MPFDGSGNFSRSYNFQQDRDNSIKVLASRVDGEFDNFAAGMNVVFFRNGLVPMSGNLSMGQNYITTLGAGAAGTPSIRFADDATSGIYLNGVGIPAIVAGGVTRLQANATGVVVTGTLNSSGALTQAGQQVWHTGNLTPGNYALLSGATFTGAVIATQLTTTGAAEALRLRDATPYISYYNSAGSTRFGYIQHTGAGGNFSIINEQAGAVSLVTPNNTFVITNTAGLALINGSTVYHSGNLTPGNYALLSGATFTGAIDVRTNLITIGTNVASAGNGGNLRLRDDTGTTRWLAGILGGAGAVNFSIYDIVGAAERLQITPAGAITVSGTLNSVGALTQAGQQVWHTGNLTPGNYALLSGATFTGGAVFSNVRATFNHAVSADNSVVIQNTSATGYGAYLRGGNGGLYALRVQDYSATTTLLDLSGAGALSVFSTITANGVNLNTAVDALLDVAQNAQAAAYQLALTDRGKHVYYTGAAAGLTIPANATVAFPIGTIITVINDGTGVLTATRAGGVTMKLGGTGANADRALAVGAMATLVKVATNVWFISGAGVT